MHQLPSRGLEHASASRFHRTGRTLTLTLTTNTYRRAMVACIFRSRRAASVYGAEGGKTLLVSNQPRTDPDDTCERAPPGRTLPPPPLPA